MMFRTSISQIIILASLLTVYTGVFASNMRICVQNATGEELKLKGLCSADDASECIESGTMNLKYVHTLSTDPKNWPNYCVDTNVTNMFHHATVTINIHDKNDNRVFYIRWVNPGIGKASFGEFVNYGSDWTHYELHEGLGDSWVAKLCKKNQGSC